MPIVAGLSLGLGALSFGSGKKEARRMRREMAKQRELAQKQLEFAKQQWGRYRETYGDIEQQMVADAMEGVVGDYAGVSSRAAADVEGQFNRVQEEQSRQMQRYGLDPSSGRFQSSDRQLDLQKATSTAMAVNQGREQERRNSIDKTWQRRQGVGSFGAGMIKSAQGDVSGAMGNMTDLAGQRAQFHGNLSNNLFNQAGQFAVMGGMQLGKHFATQPEAQPAAGANGPSYFNPDRSSYSSSLDAGMDGYESGGMGGMINNDYMMASSPATKWNSKGLAFDNKQYGDIS